MQMISGYFIRDWTDSLGIIHKIGTECQIQEDGDFYVIGKDKINKYSGILYPLIQLPEGPSDLQWLPGELPNATTVPLDCVAMVWLVQNSPKFAKMDGRFKTIKLVSPHKPSVGEQFWADFKGETIEDCGGRVKYYAWVVKPKKLKI